MIAFKTILTDYLVNHIKYYLILSLWKAKSGGRIVMFKLCSQC
jgi:hypothetical protein